MQIGDYAAVRWVYIAGPRYGTLRRRHPRRRLTTRGERMTWEKPMFEAIDLCMEVTCYRYTR